MNSDVRWIARSHTMMTWCWMCLARSESTADDPTFTANVHGEVNVGVLTVICLPLIQHSAKIVRIDTLTDEE